MPKLTKYRIIRELVINGGTLIGITSLYVAYLLGAKHWWLALIILVCCVLIGNLQSRGWLWLIRYKDKK